VYFVNFVVKKTTEAFHHKVHEEHEERTMYAAIPTRAEAAARVAVDGAFQVHKTLGPGLLESAYEHCLAYEIARRGLSGLRIGLLMNFNVALLKQGLKRFVV